MTVGARHDRVPASRDRTRAELTRGTFDLLVIGGGILGTSIAWTATQAGLRVAMVDAGDFAGATSSASSKLVHGGLRYLQTGNVRLAAENHKERRPQGGDDGPGAGHRPGTRAHPRTSGGLIRSQIRGLREPETFRGPGASPGRGSPEPAAL